MTAPDRGATYQIALASTGSSTHDAWCNGDLAMHCYLTGSMPSWFIVVTTALGPLIALFVGFAGADRWLRWQLSGKYLHASARATRGMKFRQALRPLAALGGLVQLRGRDVNDINPTLIIGN